ncbi:MAG: cupin domain-containing protein [Gammaproteobacteria bacterium]
MDALDDILKSIKLGGGVYFRCELSAPWGMAIAPTPVAEFHVVVRGTCWLHMAGLDAPLALNGGDLVVFPHGDAHALLDSTASAARPVPEILAGQNLENYGPVKYGGAGLPATLLCGYFEFDRDNMHPLVRSLPALIHLRGSDGLDFAWLQTAIRFMIQETTNSQPGSEAVVSRLAEVLFVQVLRAHLVQTGATTGLLAALSDRYVGAALRLMHGAPQEPWDLASLARRIGMSRSAFAARFHQLAGQTPMQYLSLWRMQKARELLADSRLGTAEVAARVGYQTEASFSKAFKKVIGVGPGAYRRNAARQS